MRIWPTSTVPRDNKTKKCYTIELGTHLHALTPFLVVRNFVLLIIAFCRTTNILIWLSATLNTHIRTHTDTYQNTQSTCSLNFIKFILPSPSYQNQSSIITMYGVVSYKKKPKVFSKSKKRQAHTQRNERRTRHIH